MFQPLTKRLVNYSFTFANKYSSVLSEIVSLKRSWRETHKPSACCIQVDSRPASVHQPDKMAPRGFTLKDVVRKLNAYAPCKLAESWDNVGLLVEPPTPQQITRILLTNDLTEDVMQEALNLSVNMIISYHPPIFAPLKSISSRTWKERIIGKCLENRIALYSPHTSFDAVKGGVNDWLASAFETVTVKPIIQTYTPGSCNMEIIIPESADASAVIAQLHSQMVKTDGITGDEQFITDISKTSEGTSVIRLSCPQRLLPKYEECYNTCFAESQNYVLKISKLEQLALPDYGMGRAIRLRNPMPVSQVVEKLKKFLNLPHLRLALAVRKDSSSVVTTIAMCAGSGHSVLKKAHADLFVTGEMLHHDILDVTHQGTHIILTNHSDSERGFLVAFADVLANKLLDGEVTVLVSKTDSDPIKTV